MIICNIPTAIGTTQDMQNMADVRRSDELTVAVVVFSVNVESIVDKVLFS
jgi:hypothetical protein